MLHYTTFSFRFSTLNYCPNFGGKGRDPGVNGDYYTKNGEYLGTDGKNDDKVHVASSVDTEKKGDNVLVTKAYNKETLKDVDGKDLSLIAFNAFAAAMSKEDLNKKTMFAMASATYNYARRNHSLGLARGEYDKVKYLMRQGAGYSSVKDKTFALNIKESDKRNAYASVINAATGGVDYSNGSVMWDGFDLAARGFAKHPKRRDYGLYIDPDHAKAFSAQWNDAKIRGYSGNQYTTKGDMTPGAFRGTGRYSKGRVWLRSGAVVNDVLFYKFVQKPFYLHVGKKISIFHIKDVNKGAHSNTVY